MWRAYVISTPRHSGSRHPRSVCDLSRTTASDRRCRGQGCRNQRSCSCLPAAMVGAPAAVCVRGVRASAPIASHIRRSRMRKQDTAARRGLLHSRYRVERHAAAWDTPAYEDTLASLGSSAVGARGPTSISWAGTPLLRHRPVALTCAADPSQRDRLPARRGLKRNRSLRVTEFAPLGDAESIGNRGHKTRIGANTTRVHGSRFTASRVCAGFVVPANALR